MKRPLVSRKEEGFTLIELLVALVILAVGAAGLISAMRQSAAVQERLETKTLATWVAQNRLTELHAERAWPDIGESSDNVLMGGKNWNVHVTVEATPNPDIRKVIVSTSALPASASVISLTGFMGRN